MITDYKSENVVTGLVLGDNFDQIDLKVHFMNHGYKTQFKSRIMKMQSTLLEMTITYIILIELIYTILNNI